jgi:RNA polymerase sigma-70 factor (ECF subfamily)
VYRICRNAAADAIRRQRRERQHEAPLPQEEPPGSYRGPEAEAVRASERQLVLGALELLDEDSRSILYLKEGEGISIGELGRIFGLPEGTVKSRLSRIRVKLRALLEEAGYGLE